MSSHESESSGVATQTEKQVKRPPLYKVILHNDDYTTQEFVVHVLQSIFKHTQARAYQLMMQVHQQGYGIAGVYPHEIAETKVMQTTELARQHEFPLKCSLEEA